MKYVLFTLAILICESSLAQYQDRVWLLGYGGGNQSPTNDYFGLSIITFEDGGEMTIHNNQSSNLNFDSSNSNISDSLGNLLFYSNGEKIYTPNHNLVLNGNNLNITNGYGVKQPQGALSLSYPQKQNKYLLLISEIKNFSTQVGYAGYKIYKNIIEIGETTEQSIVIEKKIEIINDTLEYGQLTATKHANGLDWWILLPAAYNNQYYTLLLDSTGLSIIDTQAMGIAFIDGLGQAVFSPNGAKYARVNSYVLSTPNDLFLYDFDRCTAKLSNPLKFIFENSGFGEGCAFSPNSRFLYAISRQKVWQYDLWEPDIGYQESG